MHGPTRLELHARSIRFKTLSLLHGSQTHLCRQEKASYVRTCPDLPLCAQMCCHHARQGAFCPPMQSPALAGDLDTRCTRALWCTQRELIFSMSLSILVCILMQVDISCLPLGLSSDKYCRVKCVWAMRAHPEQSLHARAILFHVLLVEALAGVLRVGTQCDCRQLH